MPKPRKQQISLAVTPYYHCISRCVRRSYLCGKDNLTGQNYEHRRSWIEDKALSIAQVFAIDIASYAIMSNHYHLVLFVDAEKAQQWTQAEVIIQWHKLFKGNELSQRYLQQQELTPVEENRLAIYAQQWRERLMDISWFMRTLNGYIARKANGEDQCTGHFWESRFKSQALLDDAALLACLAYVDLNPIRSSMASSLEKSDYTSIKKRCQQAKQQRYPDAIQAQYKGLHPFIGMQQKEHKPIFAEERLHTQANKHRNKTNNPIQNGICMSLSSYLELVEWTGKIQRQDKVGVISAQSHSILNRLGISQRQWCDISQIFEKSFKQFAGSEERVRKAAKQLGYKRTSGIKMCRKALG